MKINNKISVFKNYFNNDPIGETTIFKFCENVQSGERYIQNIQKIRNPETSEESRKKIKSLLPAVTPSGLFTKRKISALKEHSGFICIDIDGKDNPDVSDWPNLRDEMAEIKNILFSAISVSSQGVFLIIPLAYPDQHLEQFKRLQQDFTKAYNINIDNACSDISRLRSISYDPEAKLNLKAIPYKGLYRNKVPVKKITEYDINDELIRLIDLIVESQTDITSQYKDWFAIGCALARELGESGRVYFHQVSQFYPDYSGKQTDHQFDACLKNGYGFTKSSVFFIAENHGIYLNKYENLTKSCHDNNF